MGKAGRLEMLMDMSKEKGLKLTPQRMAIFNILAAAPDSGRYI